MIQVVTLSKSYGDQHLFDEISFSLNSGERVGVVGRNGHGKSTLFKLILGQEHADSGVIKLPKGYRVGHLSQRLEFTEDTVLKEACLALEVQEGGWIEEYRAEMVLNGLGFSEEDYHRSPTLLSGGFQIRLNLAKLLVSEPDLLLLDEPTNYLDIVTMRWLERLLRDWKGELMLITHDRQFMDQVTTHTLAIHRGKVKKIEGSTSKLYSQIAQEEEVHEKTRANQVKRREKTQILIDRFRAKASKAKMVQSRIKELERMGELEELEEIESLSFSFNSAPFEGKQILGVRDLKFGFDPSTPLISGFNLKVGKNDRIGVVGKNGKGKTTLLNLLAGEFKPDDGVIKFSDNAQVSYFGQSNVERLHPESTVEEEILEVQPVKNRTAARSICGAMMFGGDLATRKIRVLSGGERARVLLGKVLVKPANILLLDEPTNHLDLQSADTLLEAIDEFPGAVIIVTHDEYFLRQLATRLVVFHRDTVEIFEGSYDYFLERIGWDEEGGAKEKRPKSKGDSKNGAGKSVVNDQNQSALVKPLDKKINKVEGAIIALETQIKADEERLVEISQQGFSPEAVEISRSMSARRAQIAILFEELEQLSKEREELVES